MGHRLLALALHPQTGRVGTCIGSAGPTPIRAEEAERHAGAVSGQGWRCHAPDGTTIGGLVEFALPLGNVGLPIICDVEYTGSPVAPLQFDLVSLDLLSRTPAASATLLSDGEVVDSVPLL